jgi:hypothetical protein
MGSDYDYYRFFQAENQSNTIMIGSRYEEAPAGESQESPERYAHHAR